MGRFMLGAIFIILGVFELERLSHTNPNAFWLISIIAFILWAVEIWKEYKK